MEFPFSIKTHTLNFVFEILGILVPIHPSQEEIIFRDLFLYTTIPMKLIWKCVNLGTFVLLLEKNVNMGFLLEVTYIQRYSGYFITKTSDNVTLKQ